MERRGFLRLLLAAPAAGLLSLVGGRKPPTVPAVATYTTSGTDYIYCRNEIFGSGSATWSGPTLAERRKRIW